MMDMSAAMFSMKEIPPNAIAPHKGGIHILYMQMDISPGRIRFQN